MSRLVLALIFLIQVLVPGDLPALAPSSRVDESGKIAAIVAKLASRLGKREARGIQAQLMATKHPLLALALYDHLLMRVVERRMERSRYFRDRINMDEALRMATVLVSGNLSETAAELIAQDDQAVSACANFIGEKLPIGAATVALLRHAEWKERLEHILTMRDKHKFPVGVAIFIAKKKQRAVYEHFYKELLLMPGLDRALGARILEGLREEALTKFDQADRALRILQFPGGGDWLRRFSDPGDADAALDFSLRILRPDLPAHFRKPHWLADVREILKKEPRHSALFAHRLAERMRIKKKKYDEIWKQCVLRWVYGVSWVDAKRDESEIAPDLLLNTRMRSVLKAFLKYLRPKMVAAFLRKRTTVHKLNLVSFQLNELIENGVAPLTARQIMLKEGKTPYEPYERRLLCRLSAHAQDTLDAKKGYGTVYFDSEAELEDARGTLQDLQRQHHSGLLKFTWDEESHRGLVEAKWVRDGRGIRPAAVPYLTLRHRKSGGDVLNAHKEEVTAAVARYAQLACRDHAQAREDFYQELLALVSDGDSKARTIFGHSAQEIFYTPERRERALQLIARGKWMQRLSKKQDGDSRRDFCMEVLREEIPGYLAADPIVLTCAKKILAKEPRMPVIMAFYVAEAMQRTGLLYWDVWKRVYLEALGMNPDLARRSSFLFPRDVLLDPTQLGALETLLDHLSPTAVYRFLKRPGLQHKAGLLDALIRERGVHPWTARQLVLLEGAQHYSQAEMDLLVRITHAVNQAKSRRQRVAVLDFPDEASRQEAMTALSKLSSEHPTGRRPHLADWDPQRILLAPSWIRANGGQKSQLTTLVRLRIPGEIVHDVGFAMTTAQEMDVQDRLASDKYQRALSERMHWPLERLRKEKTALIVDERGNPLGFHEGSITEEFDRLVETLLRKHQCVWAQGLATAESKRLTKKSFHIPQPGILEWDAHIPLRAGDPVAARLIKAENGRTLPTHMISGRVMAGILGGKEPDKRLKALAEVSESQKGTRVLPLLYRIKGDRKEPFGYQSKAEKGQPTFIWKYLKESDGTSLFTENLTSTNTGKVSFLYSAEGWREGLQKDQPLDWKLSCKKDGIEVRVTYRKDRGNAEAPAFVYNIDLTDALIQGNPYFKDRTEKLVRDNNLTHGGQVFPAMPEEKKTILKDLFDAGILDAAAWNSHVQRMNELEPQEKVLEELKQITAPFNGSTYETAVHPATKGLIVLFDDQGKPFDYQPSLHYHPDCRKKIRAAWESKERKSFWAGGFLLKSDEELEDVEGIGTLSLHNRGFGANAAVALRYEMNVHGKPMLTHIVSYKELEQLFKGKQPEAPMKVLESEVMREMLPDGTKALVVAHYFKVTRKALDEELGCNKNVRLFVSGVRASPDKNRTVYLSAAPNTMSLTHRFPPEFGRKLVAFEITGPDFKVVKESVRLADRPEKLSGLLPAAAENPMGTSALAPQSFTHGRDEGRMRIRAKLMSAKGGILILTRIGGPLLPDPKNRLATPKQRFSDRAHVLQQVHHDSRIPHEYLEFVVLEKKEPGAVLPESPNLRVRQDAEKIAMLLRKHGLPKRDRFDVHRSIGSGLRRGMAGEQLAVIQYAGFIFLKPLYYVPLSPTEGGGTQAGKPLPQKDIPLFVLTGRPGQVESLHKAMAEYAETVELDFWRLDPAHDRELKEILFQAPEDEVWVSFVRPPVPPRPDRSWPTEIAEPDYKADKADVDAKILNTLEAMLEGKSGGDLAKMRILDLGSGDGTLLEKIQKRFPRIPSSNLYACEKNEALCKTLRKKGFNVVRGDLASLPFMDGMFDCIIMESTLVQGVVEETQGEGIVQEALRVARDVSKAGFSTGLLQDPAQEMPGVLALMKKVRVGDAQWQDGVSKMKSEFYSDPQNYLGAKHMEVLMAKDAETGVLLGALLFKDRISMEMRLAMLKLGYERPTADLFALAVDPLHRRRGIARRLAREFINLLEKRGYRSVTMQSMWPEPGETGGSRDLALEFGFRPFWPLSHILARHLTPAQAPAPKPQTPEESPAPGASA